MISHYTVATLVLTEEKNKCKGTGNKVLRAMAEMKHLVILIATGLLLSFVDSQMPMDRDAHFVHLCGEDYVKTVLHICGGDDQDSLLILQSGEY